VPDGPPSKAEQGAPDVFVIRARLLLDPRPVPVRDL
jgi:hypothetical protein